MDYVEAFRNLNPNYKYCRKSPLKAVLLLAIIDMYEEGRLADNEIRYDNALITAFANVWRRIFPTRNFFQPEAYEAFWYMQNESFWHVITVRGEEDFLDFLSANEDQPSEQKLQSCVRYIELDEDLFFLLTLRSGRTSLRKALLETNTSLSEREIELMAESKDNFADKSACAVSEYENILKAKNGSPASAKSVGGNEEMQTFLALPDDVRYVFQIEYYTFLKKHRAERELFLEVFPSVGQLYGLIALHPLERSDIAVSFVSTLVNFLSDLRISLLGEDEAMDLTEKIAQVVSALQSDEAALSPIELSQQTQDTHAAEEDLAQELFAMENAPSREDSAEQSEEDAGEDEPLDFFVENSTVRGFIYNLLGMRVYSESGKLKIFHRKVYRFNYKETCFTVKEIERYGSTWVKGEKMLVAYAGSDLFGVLDKTYFIDQIEDFEGGFILEYNRIRVDGKWYDFEGNLIGATNGRQVGKATKRKEETFAEIPEFSSNYEPKGKLKLIKDKAQCSYDILWVLAIVEFMSDKQASSTLTFDQLACMMLAEAWQMLGERPDLRQTEPKLLEGIEYLMEESREYMDTELSWASSKQQVYEAIKDYPMAGAFEEAVDDLVVTSPYDVLRIWIKNDDDEVLVARSQQNDCACLYALYPYMRDAVITVSPAWRWGLFKENDKLQQYFAAQYIEFLQNNL